jgi:PTH1 family peptidyl-tRNA hydrolase
MHLIVGLGNHGKKYQFTRHNFGFLLADQIIEDYGLKADGSKFNSEFFFGEIDQKKIIILKPQTFMNLCGSAVLPCLNFYKINQANLLILHDDLDLELGRIKVKLGGSSAGHNGLKSIDEAIGNDYFRLRLGISRPKNNLYNISNYVLSDFTESELNLVKEVNKKISKQLPLIFNDKTNNFLNNFYL